MTNSSRIPAGWYPDPLGLPQLRWWDNTAWTEHTSDSREPLVERGTVITVTPRLAWADDEPDAATGFAAETAAQTDDAPGEPQSTLPAASAPREIEAADSPPTTEPIADTDLLVGAAAPASVPATDDADDTRAPAPSERPEWAAVAAAIEASTRADEPMVVTVRSDAFPPLLLDLAERVYWWEVPLEDFPVDAEGIVATAAPRDGHILPIAAGYDLDPALWAIAVAAHPASLASWLRVDDRYRLRRWPSVPAVRHDPDLLRMTSMLSHAPLAASELAAIAGTTPTSADTLVSALSLMGLLRLFPADAADSGDVAAPAAAPPPTVVSRGLFGRLLARLGR